MVVVVLVVYLTAASKGTEYSDKDIFYAGSPTSAPTGNPITAREESGIIEQLEAGVLLRDETFLDMDKDDPRRLALDWILHTDDMQLLSDDVNLYQVSVKTPYVP